MSPLSRRGFIATAAGGLAAWSGKALAGFPPRRGTAKPRLGLIHATDLFRPHADPDDHFDLATVFALAARGRFELLAVMIDHPPADFRGDPDVQAVAQMNRLAGLAVPVLTGTPRRPDAAEAALPGNREAAAGVRSLLEIMRASDLPVALSIVGSCRDVALASRLEPRLFAEKCAGVYLNAGSGTPDPAKAARLEYNVGLDPASYAAMFDLPCPLYWLPCFEVAPGGGAGFAAGEFGTYYRFRQRDVLSRLSPGLQNYFAFMFKQGESERENQAEAEALRPNWLRCLEGPPEKGILERQGDRFRNMWCTAGFFHLAGLVVTREGAVEEGTSEVSSPLYTFDRVRVRCRPDGVTGWSAEAASRDRFLFHVRDADGYPGAMTAALAGLLASLS